MSQVKIDAMGISELMECNLAQARALLVNAHCILTSKEASLYIQEVAHQLVTARMLVCEIEKLRIDLNKIINENFPS
ncbi:hypothetical protein [Serratia fonticola]|uniref:hypothetical protein n=1 Tax=Serratia fonticola TaxID=47917 RepID=UPI00301D6F59